MTITVRLYVIVQNVSRVTHEFIVFRKTQQLKQHIITVMYTAPQKVL